MINLKHVATIFCLLALIKTTSAQSGFANELGLTMGYIEMRSDFGEREDLSNNFKNSGIAIAIVHYLNFSYRSHFNYSRQFQYFNDHFKVRNEISWNKTNLNHHGVWVEPSKTSPDADKLRAHTGYAQNFNIGSQLEFYPLNIRDFQGYGDKFAPFASVGVFYTYSTPGVTTNYNNPNPSAIGDVNDPSNFHSGWPPGSVDASPTSNWSIVSDVGTRYKITKFSDILIEFRFQFFNNDFVDGLNHDTDANKYNDSMIALSLGYVYYIN